jgi:hypothetical protein
MNEKKKYRYDIKKEVSHTHLKKIVIEKNLIEFSSINR